MLETLDAKAVLPRVEAYFNMLKRMGYVKQSTTSRYLVYIFLCDFTDTLYDFFCDEDYVKVNKLLVSLFSDGGCLLPYRTIPGRRVHIGTPRYDRLDIDKRITEDGAENRDRITENDYVRAGF